MHGQNWGMTILEVYMDDMIAVTRKKLHKRNYIS